MRNQFPNLFIIDVPNSVPAASISAYINRVAGDHLLGVALLRPDPPSLEYVGPKKAVLKYMTYAASDTDIKTLTGGA